MNNGVSLKTDGQFNFLAPKKGIYKNLNGPHTLWNYSFDFKTRPTIYGLCE